ncbi:hypothetical protein N8I71_08645 [Roseibacterium sp. SDUM158016]|uniref:hypothetical protein n=1 Tax=Roseicyclus sediminis TaxID=2980997 RepID=UPI0021CF38E9|nr:hypothetical protein [Roseibacterium sp. SDUM158016]MCU4652898.1 hypothetical protein [Roseibacterium sp. SDUM158016]
MRSSAAALLLALLAGGAQAQHLDQHEAATLPRIIDSLCVDLHPETGCETAILLQSSEEPDTADLVILGDRRSAAGAQPLAVARAIVFNGAMWGMAPSLEAGEARTLTLLSEQIGIGRNAWMQALTIGYGPDGFAVRAFHWSTYDRAIGGAFSCDLDLATGVYGLEASAANPETGEERVLFAETGSVPAGVVPVSDWPAFGPLPAPCEEGHARYAARE